MLQDLQYIKREIFEMGSKPVENLILELFQYQAASNKVYKQWIKHLGINVRQVQAVSSIPFIPVKLFSSHEITDGGEVQKIFISSGTTGKGQSKHHVVDLDLYRKSYLATFEKFYGKPTNYRIQAYLPGYNDNPGSSLIHMIKGLIESSQHPQSGFYWKREKELWEPSTSKTILFGVSFGLLDLAQKYGQPLKNTIIMETGGMKGQGPEITREALHDRLIEAFGVEIVHSEYGMTELLSQAYSKGQGLFETPPRMKVLIRDIRDPMDYVPIGETGGINIIDLANIHSCAFIATDDLGLMHKDGRFEVLGRFDHSELRGCNLMY